MTLTVNIGDIEANATTALHMTVLAGYWHYVKQVIEKLAALINGDIYVQVKESPKKSAKALKETEPPPGSG